MSLIKIDDNLAVDPQDVSAVYHAGSTTYVKLGNIIRDTELSVGEVLRKLSGDVESWQYLREVPSGVYIVTDRFGDEWWSYGGQTSWRRKRDDANARTVEYTGPFTR